MNEPAVAAQIRPHIRAEDPPAPVFLQTERLGLRYARHPALADVTLPIRRGRITALVGPSGCGKTSFLACLNRMTDLLSGAVVSGSVTVDGTDVLDPRLDVVALRRRIGMIFQRPNPFPVSVRKNFALPLRESGVRGRAAVAEVMEECLRSVGLWDEVRDRLDGPARGLSGGQQQRLCIARALALRPEALLLDEPCSALDPLSSAVVEELIAGLRGRLTVVIVTHNLAQARRIADDAALFWVRDGAGRLVESGPAKEFFGAPRDPLAAAYLSGARG